MRTRTSWSWLLWVAVACSSGPDHDHDTPCGGEGACRADYSCQDRGDGYRCHPDDVAGLEPGGGGSDGGRTPTTAPTGAAAPGVGGADAPASMDASVDAPGQPEVDAATPPSTGTCRDASITFLIDGSGSMCDVFGEATRWDAVRASLVDPEDGFAFRMQSRLEIGVVVFDGTIDVAIISTPPAGSAPGPACAGLYMTSATTGDCPRLVEVLPARDNAAAIAAAYPTMLPGGSTPTHRVMTAAVDRILSAANGSTRTHAIVLVTDGFPNDICVGGVGGDGVAQQNEVLLAAERAAGAGVTTYVVDMHGTDSALGLFLSELTERGSPEPEATSPFAPADETELRASLDWITQEVLGCVP